MSHLRERSTGSTLPYMGRLKKSGTLGMYQSPDPCWGATIPVLTLCVKAVRARVGN